jgi:Magnesium chelatase, subunit ChlI
MAGQERKGAIGGTAIPSHRMRSTETRFRLVSTCRPSGRLDCEYPRPCGYAGDPEKECTCSLTLISRYQKRLSGPLLDRIDIHVEVPRVPFHTCPSAAPRAVPRGKLSDDRRGEPSAAIRERAGRQASSYGSDSILTWLTARSVGAVHGFA